MKEKKRRQELEQLACRVGFHTRVDGTHGLGSAMDERKVSPVSDCPFETACEPTYSVAIHAFQPERKKERKKLEVQHPA